MYDVCLVILSDCFTKNNNIKYLYSPNLLRAEHLAAMHVKKICKNIAEKLKVMLISSFSSFPDLTLLAWLFIL